MKHARSGRILIQVAVIIAIGAILGLADAFVLRPIDLKPRSAPPPITDLPTGTGERPKSHGTHLVAVTPSATTETPPEKPVEKPPVNTTPKPDPTPANTGGDKPFVPTAKADIPAGQITIDEAKILYDRGLADGNTYFVDARKLEDYIKGHVTNAIRMDTAMFADREPAELGLIPRTGVVVVYCNGGHCDESENVAKRLDGSGYKIVYVLHDGFPGWKAMGHPIATGE